MSTRPGFARRVPLVRNPLTTMWLLVRRGLLRHAIREADDHARDMDVTGRMAPRVARIYRAKAEQLREELRELEQQL